MKKVIPVLIALVLIVIIGAATAGSIVFEKYSYSKEQANLQEYFKVQGDELAIILQDERMEEKAHLVNDTCYFDLDTVHKYFNDTFYVDKNEGLLLYALPTTVDRYVLGDGPVSATGEKNPVYRQGETIFLAADLVKKYTNYSFDERYMSLKNFVRTGSFFGMDYIYTELTEDVDPINFEKLVNSKMEYYVVATDAETSKPVYFGKEDVEKHRGDVFKASCSIPAMCQPIEIDSKLYFDGGVSDSIPVRRALEDGCDKVVAVLTRPRGYVKKPEMGKTIYSEILKDYPAIIKAMNVRHYVYNKTLENLFELEKQGKAFVFCPEQSERVSIISRNKEELVTLYNEGKVSPELQIEKLNAFMNE